MDKIDCDEFLIEDNYLEHYGVLGMKWGVRNAETQARYAGGSSKKKRNKKVSSLKSRIIGSVQARKKLKDTASKAGYSKISEYKNARKIALYSHDPAAVARNMRTLTDAELSNKIKRLTAEKKIIDLVPPKTKSIGAQALENLAKTATTTAGVNIGKAIGNALTTNSSKTVSNSSSKDKGSPEPKKKTKRFKNAMKFSNKTVSSVGKTTKSNGKTVLDYYNESPVKYLPGPIDTSGYNNEKDRK